MIIVIVVDCVATSVLLIVLVGLIVIIIIVVLLTLLLLREVFSERLAPKYVIYLFWDNSTTHLLFNGITPCNR